MKNETYTWYETLIKPRWSPPSWIFGPVWSVLYIIIFVSYGYVLQEVITGKIPRIVLLPFVLNILFNAIFTPIQFGLKNNELAFADILLVLSTLIWALTHIYPYAQWVVFINIPYVLWVCFATVLQFNITILNAHT